jgi:hypothetical protein
MSVTTFQTQFLSEVAAGFAGPPIPSPKRAYFQQRLRNRVFSFLLNKFLIAQSKGLTKAMLARRTGSTPDLVSRRLGAPSNMTLDVICDLLLGISGEEVELESSSPLAKVENNYSLYDELSSIPDIEEETATQPLPIVRGANSAEKMSAVSFQRESSSAAALLDFDRGRPGQQSLETAIGGE